MDEQAKMNGPSLFCEYCGKKEVLSPCYNCLGKNRNLAYCRGCGDVCVFCKRKCEICKARLPILTESEIIEALQHKAYENLYKKPLGKNEVSLAEEQLGFKLPDLLVRIYTEVANGGFGPTYGFLGLIGGHLDDGRDIVSSYHYFMEYEWIREMLPIAHVGCGIYLCVKCDEIEAPIIKFDHHIEGNSWRDSFVPHSSSLKYYLSVWVQGKCIHPSFDFVEPNWS